MVTDSRSAVAGRYPQRFPLRLTCILKEGNITKTGAGAVFSKKGDTADNFAFASILKEGDIVGLSDDEANTFVATGGIPVVERGEDQEALIFGKIVTSPDWLENIPAASQTVWADMLTGKYYRVAEVELWGGITKVEKATVQTNGTNGVAIGVGATLNVNLADMYANGVLSFITAAANGVGVIPLHYVAAGSAGDQSSILAGITGLMYSVTGS